MLRKNIFKNKIKNKINSENKLLFILRFKNDERNEFREGEF